VLRAAPVSRFESPGVALRRSALMIVDNDDPVGQWLIEATAQVTGAVGSATYPLIIRQPTLRTR